MALCTLCCISCTRYIRANECLFFFCKYIFWLLPSKDFGLFNKTSTLFPFGYILFNFPFAYRQIHCVFCRILNGFGAVYKTWLWTTCLFQSVIWVYLCMVRRFVSEFYFHAHVVFLPNINSTPTNYTLIEKKTFLIKVYSQSGSMNILYGHNFCITKIEKLFLFTDSLCIRYVCVLCLCITEAIRFIETAQYSYSYDPITIHFIRTKW